MQKPDEERIECKSGHPANDSLGLRVNAVQLGLYVIKFFTGLRYFNFADLCDLPRLLCASGKLSEAWELVKGTEREQAILFFD